MASYAASGPSASPAASTTSAAPGSHPQAGGQQQQAPDGAGDPGAASQHKRVYQACIPCRRRKVRCDLGSVDNPHDPPCVRCRRESKECFFSATRRKRKNEDGTDATEADLDEYIVRNGRKRVNTNASPPPVDHRLFSEGPLTPGGGPGRDKPLSRPDVSRSGGITPGSALGRGANGRDNFGGIEEPNTQLENKEAQSVLRQSVFGTHDALDLLYKAATNTSVPSFVSDDKIPTDI